MTFQPRFRTPMLRVILVAGLAISPIVASAAPAHAAPPTAPMFPTVSVDVGCGTYGCLAHGTCNGDLLLATQNSSTNTTTATYALWGSVSSTYAGNYIIECTLTNNSPTSTVAIPLYKGAYTAGERTATLTPSSGFRLCVRAGGDFSNFPYQPIHSEATNCTYG